MLDTLSVEFAGSAASKGLSLEIHPTSLSVVTDSALLETILRNLLGNAIKFTDRGRVGILTRQRAGLAEIVVFDTGIGIDAQHQTMIFGQFERVRQHSSAREGLGLGLSIVQRMAELLDMKVGLQSTVGRGSEFTLTLRLATLAPPSNDAAQAPELNLSGQSILVLDDHQEACRAIALAIETLGGVCLKAASPDAAFDLLARMAPAKPHAAIVDHDLGWKQTGPDFLNTYAARYGRELPAVIVTGSTDASTLARLANAGRPWLIKPVDLDALRRVLSEIGLDG